jgi:hypothetical protein
MTMLSAFEAFPMIIQLVARLHETLVVDPHPTSIVATLALQAAGTRLFSMLFTPRLQQQNKNMAAMIEWIYLTLPGFLVLHHPLTSAIMGAIWIGMHQFYYTEEGRPYYASTREKFLGQVVTTWILSAFLARFLSQVWRSAWDVCVQCAQHVIGATIAFLYNMSRHMGATICSGVADVLRCCFHNLQDSRDDDYSEDESQNDIAWKSKHYVIVEEVDEVVPEEMMLLVLPDEMAYQHDLGSVHTDGGRRSRRLVGFSAPSTEQGVIFDKENQRTPPKNCRQHQSPYNLRNLEI